MALAADSTPDALDVRPVAGSIGAEVRDIRIDSLDRTVAARLSALLADHLVLFFPGLTPTVSQLRDLGALFGPLEEHQYIEKVDADTPEVCVLDTSRTPKADVWHTDVTYSPHPPVATVLHMAEGPECGGDTMWMNTQLVFESLSPPMQEMLTGLTCIHDSGRQGDDQAEHPVVRVHPVTGHRSLYVNKQWSRRIPQLSRPESEALLTFLFRWQEQVRYSCRWRWSDGDVAIWDNRATLHAMVADTEERRVLHRVTVLGDDPQPPEGAREWPRYRSDKTASSGYYGVAGYEF
ncbi:MAG: TauD/TfdA family dioxygenase [Acidimicrobiia bacterium]|nr:TauD/TfdA family dioxygenase [Acidimicrobiia bacterium]